MRLVFWLLLFCLWSGEMVGMELAKSFPIDSISNFSIEIVKIEPTCKSDSVRFYIKAIGIFEDSLNFDVAFITNGAKSPVFSQKDGRNYILSTFLPKSGNIFITATDVKGITFTLTRSVSSIPKYQEPKSILTSILNSSESKSTGIINGSFSDGSSPYKITLLNNSKTEEVVLTTERKFSFDSLSSGTYKIKITDACNNSDSSTVTVKADCKLAFKSKPKGSFDCKSNGKIDWSLTVEPTTSIQAYAILQGSIQPRIDIESNGKGTEFEKTELKAGVYQVVIQGDMCNFFDTTIVLSAPNSPIITSDVKSINCSNDNIGEITLTVSGGLPPYKYKWNDNANTSNQRTKLDLGTYTVIVTDSASCSTTGTYKITRIPKPVLSVNPASANPTVVTLKCAGDKNGEVTLVVNPTRTYTYIWSDGKTGQTRSDLAKGEYKVKARDGQQATCESNELTITVKEPDSLKLTLDPITNPTCPSNNNGTITAKVTGGTSSYTFSWTGGKTTQTITSLVEGSYTVMVTDKNGCGSVIASTTLMAPKGPIITDPRIQDIICSSENTGRIDVTVSGAVSYSWTNAQNIVVGTAEDLIGVPSGIYTLKVTDAKGCITTKSETITQTLPPKNITYINGNVSCKGSKDGKIEFKIGAGEPAVTFRWYDGDTLNKAISNLGAGAYGLTITNVENRCTTSQLLKVEEPPEALKSNGIKILTRSTCNDKEEGSIEVNPTGGWGGYTYQWFKDGIQLPDRGNRIKASSGKYKVVIQDSIVCMVMDEVDLNVEGNLFYNLYPTKETYSSTISPNLLKEAWDDPELTLPLAPNSDFTLFGTKEKIDTLWLLDEFAGVVLSTKKVGKNLPNDTASLIIVYGADLVDRAYKLWNRKQASSISPITVQPKPDIGGRIWILEWKNAGFFNELDEFGSAASAINFQLWIYEKTKNLELKFGTSTPNALPNPSLLFNGKSGPMIALVKGYNFQNDTYKDLWYLRGAANNPTPQVLRNGKLQEFNETLDSHPVSNQVYRFCAVAPVRFAPDPIPEIEIKVTPNPTYERATVKFSPLLQPAQVWVSDQLGRKVLLEKELAIGDTEITLNLQGLPKGIYLIHLNGAQRTQVHKVIKQ